MIRLLIALMLLVSFTSASASNRIAGPTPVGKGVVIVIDTAISNATMGRVLDEMRKMNTNTKYEGPKVVDLVLNSPGGSVVTGFEFLSLMSALQDNGWKFNCSVYHVAASMAYQILNQCDRRQSLRNSFLLWHRARVYIGGLFGSAMTAPLAATLAESLDSIDSIIFGQLQDYMGPEGADDEYLSKHFEAETLHVGANLSDRLPSYIQTYSSIPGLLDALANDKVIRTQKGGSFFDEIRFGDIIYIRQ